MKSLSDVMNKNVITISKETNLLEIIDIMKKHGVGRLPVIENGKILGVVTRDDLLIKGEKAPVPPILAINDLTLAFTNNKEFKEKMKKYVAYDAEGLMRKEYFKVTKEDTIEYVITNILEEFEEFALVVENEKLIGIVTKSDLINSI